MRSPGSSGQRNPCSVPSRPHERHDEPVAVPGARPAAVERRRVARLRDARARDVERQQVAAFDLELGVEQRRDRLGREPARRRACRAPAGATRVERNRRGPDARARSRCARSRARAGSRRRRPGGSRPRSGVSARRSDTCKRCVQRLAVPRDGLVGLRVLDRERDVLGDRDEHVERFVVGTAQGVGLVDRQHAEQRAVRRLQRYEQNVLRMPGAGIVGNRIHRRRVARPRPAPVVRAVRNHVRPAAQEALVEQRAVVLDACACSR